MVIEISVSSRLPAQQFIEAIQGTLQIPRPMRDAFIAVRPSPDRPKGAIDVSQRATIPAGHPLRDVFEYAKGTSRSNQWIITTAEIFMDFEQQIVPSVAYQFNPSPVTTLRPDLYGFAPWVDAPAHRNPRTRALDERRFDNKTICVVSAPQDKCFPWGYQQRGAVEDGWTVPSEQIWGNRPGAQPFMMRDTPGARHTPGLMAIGIEFSFSLIGPSPAGRLLEVFPVPIRQEEIARALLHEMGHAGRILRRLPAGDADGEFQRSVTNPINQVIPEQDYEIQILRLHLQQRFSRP